ncbi:endoribonuclease Dicer-like [Tropilaelaps mercedesae]|uniref:Endoribonuclease Dicer-like n=1 Tax=Tropilaelaps mercedesae TaxID=418985 RepID=A0A1V9XCJ0_9ACAR|nr:endoribonuclease Dicer-like [Tropilaelaps mercedesae]
MCPAGEQTKMAKHLAELKESELQVLKFCLRENVDIDDTDVEQALQDDPDLPTIYAFPERPAESAIITAQSARSTLQWYCDTLSADRFKVLRPIFRYETVQEDSSAVRVKCTVELPRESKIHEEQLSGNPLDNRVKAKISAALRACRRLYEIGELTENLVPKKRPRTDVYEWQDAEVSADVRKLFIGNTITQASTINCERDQAEQLRTHQVPKLPASAKVFVFRVRLDERNVDEFYRGRVFNAKKERVSFGVLTFVCETNSQIPNFPIFTKAGRELVHVQELNDVRVTDEQWNLIYPFHSFMLTRVLRLPGVSCDASLAPVIVPIVKCKLDYALMAKLEPGTPLPLNEMSVVTFPVKSESGGEILHSWFVGELYDMDGVPHISLMRIPKNIDFIKNRYKDKTQNRDATDKAIKERHSKPRDMCTIEPLTAPQWMKGLSVASCCHRLNRLLVAEKLRMTFVLRGIGTAYQKQATMMYERVVSNPTTRSQQTIVLNNLNFIPESGAQSKPKLRGPSVVDIYTALSPLSADDVVDSENYEVIGDAFLKLVVTLDLFRRFETEDEGYLTRQRCRMVSNMHLLTLAVPLGIHNMVESLKFSARTNFRPPGCVFETDRRELFMQQYKGKICADSVEALIGVYLEKAGGNGALDFLTGLGLPLSCAKRGSFTSRFNLRWTPPPANDIAAHSHRLCHVEAVLGYDFSNRCLLLEAITHQSYRYHRGTRSYERLEFLGDAVIDYLVSRFLYCNCPQLSPGDLTNARSAIVCNATFARVVVERDLHKHLLHHSPVLHKLTDSYLAALKKGLLDETLICEDETDDVNCVDVPKPLGDLLESLIGAVFLDCKMNFARVWEVFRRLMGDNLLKNYLVNIPRNPVAVLMEMFPRQIAFNGPQVLEDKRIRMEMTVEGEHFVAVARNKKVATKALAKKALRHFDRVKRRGQGALGPMENIANELQL